MEFSLKATCQHGFLVDLYGSLICMNFSMDMNSSLVLLKLDVKLNLLSHISQWNFVCNFIQSCLPLKSCHFKSRCPIEAFVAYLKMKSCLLFHFKLWIFEMNSSFVFKSRCQIGSFVTYLTMEFCLFFSSKLLFRMDFWYEFKSCPFQTSCPTESLVAYLTMEPCVLFHPKIWIFDQNSSLVLKSGCQIESFVSYLTMECSFKASCQYGFLVDL